MSSRCIFPTERYLIGQPCTQPVETPPASPPWGLLDDDAGQGEGADEREGDQGQAQTRCSWFHRSLLSGAMLASNAGGRVTVANPLPGERRRGRIGSRVAFRVHGTAGFRLWHTPNGVARRGIPRCQVPTLPGATRADRGSARVRDAARPPRRSGRCCASVAATAGLPRPRDARPASLAA